MLPAQTDYVNSIKPTSHGSDPLLLGVLYHILGKMANEQNINYRFSGNKCIKAAIARRHPAKEERDNLHRVQVQLECAAKILDTSLYRTLMTLS